MNSTTQLHQNQYLTYASINPACVIYLNEMKTRKTSFDNVLIEAVDVTFTRLLGNHGKQAIYTTLASHYGISKENIPRDIEGFTNALEHIFGHSSVLLETQIMQALHSRLSHIQVFQAAEDLSFKGYVENIRRSFNSDT
jgi:hypothetical protein